MATINLNNILEYIKQGLIDPTKIKIDLNKNKTTSDPNHKWITLDNAIKQGIDFLFDYNVKELLTPATLPEVTVTTLKKSKLVPRKINPYITQEQISKLKENEGHWYDYGVNNFKNTFKVSPREVADFVPILGDVLTLGDIKSSLDKGNYGEAALVSGIFILPNVIKKPFKYLRKWNTNRKLSKLINDLDFIPEYAGYISNPSLSDIGSFQDYKNYLTTIFPESSYSDLVFHGGRKDIKTFHTPKDPNHKANFKVTKNSNGIYFSPDRSVAEQYKSNLGKNGQMYIAKLNIPRLGLWNFPANSPIKSLFYKNNPDGITDQLLNNYFKNYDGIIDLNINRMPQIAVFDPENIHILGSDKDRFNFFKFVLKGKLPIIKSVINIDKDFSSELNKFSLKEGLKDILKPIGITGLSLYGIYSGTKYLQNKEKEKLINEFIKNTSFIPEHLRYLFTNEYVNNLRNKYKDLNESEQIRRIYYELAPIYYKYLEDFEKSQINQN